MSAIQASGTPVKAWRASASMTARDVPLPISSSVVHSIVTGGCGVEVPPTLLARADEVIE